MTLPRYERVGGSDGLVIMRGYGPTLPELFENCAEAMFGIGRALTEIPSTYSRPLVAPGDTYQELLSNWLEELLYVGRTEALVWSSSFVDRLEPGGVQGSASGQPTANVAPASQVAIGVRRVRSDIVSIPEGHWVEVEFDTGGTLRAV